MSILWFPGLKTNCLTKFHHKVFPHVEIFLFQNEGVTRLIEYTKSKVQSLEHTQNPSLRSRGIEIRCSSPSFARWLTWNRERDRREKSVIVYITWVNHLESLDPLWGKHRKQTPVVQPGIEYLSVFVIPEILMSTTTSPRQNLSHNFSLWSCLFLGQVLVCSLSGQTHCRERLSVLYFLSVWTTKAIWVVLGEGAA